MIVLTVLSLNGSACTMAPVSFDELGGSIGRADTNQLVLPDQDRTISRLHAQVVFRNGRYALIDLGANAVLHNGQAVGHGREVMVQPGDNVEIGGYKIAVSAPSAITRAHDPFAGFESDIAATPVSKPRPALKPAALQASSPMPAPAARAASASAPQRSLGAGIPEDWDPFHQDRPAAAQPASAASASASAGLGLSGEPSLDDLFGLGNPVPAAAAAPVTRDDHASEMAVPWTDGFAVPRQKDAPRHEPVPIAAEPDLAVEASAPTADAQALINAFVSGLGVADLRLRPITTEAMFELGQTLRAYTVGTMDLLVARGALKKEVRADVTMMAARANNVLKFSPTVEFALQHLLATRSPGFMGALDSVEDSFEDLKSHQLGMMAGMHAALQGVLKRFNPVEIEKKVGHQSGLFGLGSSGKKARLWELFQEMYGQSASQAKDDFDDLFGKAFAREYDRFVAELSVKGGDKK
jgi:type VI secretion system FHA domain protein